MTQAWTEGVTNNTNGDQSTSETFHTSGFNLAKVIVTTVQFIVALIGNSLSVAVMLRKPFRKTSTGVFLITLVVCDTGNLAINTIMFAVYWDDTVPYLAQSNAICKIATFLPYFTAQLSSWILVNISVERFVAIHFPFKAKLVYTPYRLFICLALTVVVVFVANLHYFIVYELVRYDSGGLVCATSESQAIMLFFSWIDSCVFSIIPIILIICLNTTITIKLCQAQQFRNRFDKDKGCSREQMDAFRTILLVTTTFVVLTLPVSIWGVYFAVFYEDNEIDNFSMDVFNITHAIMNTNFCINFFLYCLTGRKFRNELRGMCCQTQASAGPIVSLQRSKGTPEAVSKI